MIEVLAHPAVISFLVASAALVLAIGVLGWSLARLQASRELEALSVLRDHGEMTGIEIVRASCSIRSGAVYLLLDGLERRGLIESWEHEPGRVTYAITGSGLKHLRKVLRGGDR